MEDKVVARYVGGKVVKGVTRDFHPQKNAFHIYPTEETYLKKGVEILTKDLKALFFVKTLEGNPDYLKKREFPEEYAKSRGKKCVVAFKDGEIFYAYSQTYSKRKHGFFVFPADMESNNQRVFILRDAVVGVQFFEEQEIDSMVSEDGVVRATTDEAEPVIPAQPREPSELAEELEADLVPPGPDQFKPHVKEAYDNIMKHYRHGHEREFNKAFAALLKSVWFEDITKWITKRGLLKFGRKPRFYARGGIKEMGKSNDTKIGWPEFEAVPKFANALSEMFSKGQKLEHFSMDERERIRKFISQVHNETDENIYLVAGGLAVWNGFNLSFYDSREEYYTVLTGQKADSNDERINALSSHDGRILINDLPIPVTINEKVLLSLCWEWNYSFHPHNPVQRFL